MNIQEIKTYVRYIKEHRKENKRLVKESLPRFNKSIRGCISTSCVLHDYNKLFTLKLLKYVDAYSEITKGFVNSPEDTFLKEFSHHDEWIYSQLATQMLQQSTLIRFISKPYIDAYFKPLSDPFEIVEDIKSLCKTFGESPQAFYLRNYGAIGIKSNLVRCLMEEELEISFDDYFDNTTPRTCVRDIFDRENESFNPGLAYHVFLSCLTQYGVNIYDALELTDVYEGINDKVEVVG